MAKVYDAADVIVQQVKLFPALDSLKYLMYRPYIFYVLAVYYVWIIAIQIRLKPMGCMISWIYQRLDSISL